MVSVRPFLCSDLLKFGSINLDPYTETYNTTFYLHYLSMWPEHMQVLESPMLSAFQSTSVNPSVIRTNLIDGPSTTTDLDCPPIVNSMPITCGQLMGYMMAKSEGQGTDWHGHVTALSVAPEYRRLGLATQLMLELEETSERKRCYYVDLFVRASNKLGLEIYTKLGYIIYRRVLNYYWSSIEDEDAFDMRKALSADTDKKSVIPMTRPIRPEELEHP
ncbi:N-terminal acetyltransferase B complex catalytic subunit [Paragonimus westermani]|uniref:N-alpha-acetyltransferase 20 n=1 Tax=Paragonimus westermani TaxID=34504 RepID=A0A5J4NNV0_9TREM|nr:N-terminal acetyltransferase B complex catalytic subunit [Paragonimus westermani]